MKRGRFTAHAAARWTRCTLDPLRETERPPVPNNPLADQETMIVAKVLSYLYIRVWLTGYGGC